ncbi:shikimate kinase [Allosphingosinicella vermicomposti]|uniref:shikimate kinase n=1 Tax=Allosphingosinicella vermicomposti TaxID=614671 RepID=UPI0018F8984B|nr:shikimate kinase [Allosphingosinicella vermicomposti]
MTRPISSPDRSIVLVGLMGAGKSTVGRRLAKRLRMPFVDSDAEIEDAADRSIAEIFEQYGEESFRDGERRVIARLIEGRPKVIATGGGAFMNDRTRALILSRCIAVWLDADPAILAERVSRRDTRPLLKDKEALPFLRDLAEMRNPIYAQAHIRIHTEPLPHDRAVGEIVRALRAMVETA